MVRNACTNHPDKKVIEIPPGSTFCTACCNLVPPDWKPVEIVKIVQEMALEEESEEGIEEVVLEALTEVPQVIAKGTGEPEPKIVIVPLEVTELLDSEHEDIHDSMETPVEAEPEPCEPVVGDLDELAKTPYLKEIIEEGKVKAAIAAENLKKAERRTLEDKQAQEAKTAEIEALRAKLAELEK